MEKLLQWNTFIVYLNWSFTQLTDHSFIRRALVIKPTQQTLLMDVKHCAFTLARCDHRPQYLLPDTWVDLETYPTGLLFPYLLLLFDSLTPTLFQIPHLMLDFSRLRKPESVLQKYSWLFNFSNYSFWSRIHFFQWFLLIFLIWAVAVHDSYAC